jgi:hypothetical protein
MPIPRKWTEMLTLLLPMVSPCHIINLSLPFITPSLYLAYWQVARPVGTPNLDLWPKTPVTIKGYTKIGLNLREFIGICHWKVRSWITHTVNLSRDSWGPQCCEFHFSWLYLPVCLAFVTLLPCGRKMGLAAPHWLEKEQSQLFCPVISSILCFSLIGPTNCLG